MIDREKVIKGLECCRINELRRINCVDCPYYTDDDKGQMWCSNDVHNDAIALLKEQQQLIWELQDQVEYLTDKLKEQEAVNPNPVHNSFRWFACGKCDCSITREDRFCPRCGKAVKWE